jgi:hypothetical protein
VKGSRAVAYGGGTWKRMRGIGFCDDDDLEKGEEMRIDQRIFLVEIVGVGRKKSGHLGLGTEDELPSVRVFPYTWCTKIEGKIGPTWMDKKEVEKKLDASFVEKKGVYYVALGSSRIGNPSNWMPVSFQLKMDCSKDMYCWLLKVNGDGFYAHPKNNPRYCTGTCFFKVLYLYLVLQYIALQK